MSPYFFLDNQTIISKQNRSHFLIKKHDLEEPRHVTMSSSGKNQIIRQKNIELPGSNMPTLSVTEPEEGACKPILTDELSEELGEPLEEQLSRSLGTTKLLSSQDLLSKKACEHRSASPTNRVPMEEKKSPTTNLNSKTLAAFISNGNKIHLSTALKERIRRSKSPNPDKPLVSNHSVPTAGDHKQSRLAYFSNRLSNSSFFSRSCQGEELSAVAAASSSHQTASSSKLSPQVSDDKGDCTKSNSSSANTSSSSINNVSRSAGKGFLAFARAPPSKQAAKKMTDSAGSLGFTSVSVDENDSVMSSSFSSTNSKQNSIGSYEVDFEKLARELILPSLNEPLTSFKPSGQLGKPILLSSKTIDEHTSLPKNKTMLRSFTQTNKQNF